MTTLATLTKTAECDGCGVPLSVAQDGTATALLQRNDGTVFENPENTTCYTGGPAHDYGQVYAWRVTWTDTRHVPRMAIVVGTRMDLRAEFAALDAAGHRRVTGTDVATGMALYGRN